MQWCYCVATELVSRLSNRLQVQRAYSVDVRAVKHNSNGEKPVSWPFCLVVIFNPTNPVAVIKRSIMANRGQQYKLRSQPSLTSEPPSAPASPSSRRHASSGSSSPAASFPYTLTVDGKVAKEDSASVLAELRDAGGRKQGRDVLLYADQYPSADFCLYRELITRQC